MKKFILLVLSAALLISFAACGNNQAQGNPSGAQEETKGTDTGTPDSTTGANTVTRIVTDARGEVEIPAAPERIVDLSGNSDILALLGLSVVGTANSDAYDYTKFPSYLEEVLGEAEILGFSYQDTMDIEGVMNVSPDLIIISTVQEKMYEQLKQIAPTVMLQLEALDWKEDVRTVAGLFDRNEEAEAWISRYETKALEAGSAIKKLNGEDPTYLAFLASSAQFYVFSGAGFGDILYKDMGLSVPPGLPEQENVSLPVVTYEGLAAIEADYIFVIATETDRAELEKSSIWNGLPAVKDGRLVVLPTSPYFNQGYSPIGKLLLLDEIPEYINDLQGK